MAVRDMFPYPKKEFPGFCSICGEELRKNDYISRKIRQARYSPKENKKMAAIIEIIDLKVQGRVKHDKCKGVPKYCPNEGSVLELSGAFLYSYKNGDKTGLRCSKCNYVTQRPMVPEDEFRRNYGFRAYLYFR